MLIRHLVDSGVKVFSILVCFLFVLSLIEKRLGKSLSIIIDLSISQFLICVNNSVIRCKQI